MRTDEEFWARVVGGDVADCWEWQGARTPDGYGRVWIHFDDGTKKTYAAHRVAYSLMRADILGSRIPLDHECSNPPCVNPWHLDVVNWHTNSRRMVERGRSRNICTDPSQVRYSPYPTPWYQRVVAELCDRMDAGELTPDDQLLSPGLLRQKFNLNRTQAHAVRSWLQAKGYLPAEREPRLE
jgi:hypothetical protein